MQETKIDLPKPFWQSRAFLIWLALCLTLIISTVYVICLRVPPLIISEKTTRITEPLTADGQIDFFKALELRFYPPQLATDDNGFRDVVRLFGDVSDMVTKPDREFYRRQKYEKLGLDLNVSPTLTFPIEPRAVIRNFYEAKGEVAPADEDTIVHVPWTLKQMPMLEDWISSIDIPLDAIAKAIQKPVFIAPFLQNRESFESGNPLNLTALLLPDAFAFQNMARQFHARATYRIAQGNIDGAIDDKLTIHRLGRLTSQGSFIVQYLISINIEEGAMMITATQSPALFCWSN